MRNFAEVLSAWARHNPSFLDDEHDPPHGNNGWVTATELAEHLQTWIDDGDDGIAYDGEAIADSLVERGLEALLVEQSRGKPHGLTKTFGRWRAAGRAQGTALTLWRVVATTKGRRVNLSDRAEQSAVEQAFGAALSSAFELAAKDYAEAKAAQDLALAAAFESPDCTILTLGTVVEVDAIARTLHHIAPTLMCPRLILALKTCRVQVVSAVAPRARGRLDMQFFTTAATDEIAHVRMATLMKAVACITGGAGGGPSKKTKHSTSVGAPRQRSVFGGAGGAGGATRNSPGLTPKSKRSRAREEGWLPDDRQSQGALRRPSALLIVGGPIYLFCIWPSPHGR